jgi:aspartate/methionine/tyrosine aminotransferase
MMSKYDMGFGHSVCVRQAFLDVYNGHPITFHDLDLNKFDYPKHEGDEEVVAIVKDFMKRQFGKEYKHVLLTNGATGGIVITMRAYAQKGCKFCQTRSAPNYLRYPGMIKAAGLEHVHQNRWTTDNTVCLLDMPSNPLGLMDNPMNSTVAPTILDGVYFNNVYTQGNVKLVPHNEFVGSFSKLLGLNGIRIGWIATDNSLMYERLRELVVSEYCGLDIASSVILKNALRHFRWDIFEIYARDNLNFNREEWAKLERYFEGTPVAENGMFYYAKMDASCKRLMEKSGVLWTPGSLLGTGDNYGRFSLGQGCELTQEAVKTVIKNDTI